MVCGEKFSLPDCHAKRKNVGKYCTHACMRKHMEEKKKERERTCESCGATFYPRATQIRDGGGRFCSLKCHHSFCVGENHHSFGKEVSRSSVIKCQETKIKNGTLYSGERHPAWKDEIICGGYVFIKISGKKKALHRHLVEKRIGRKLKRHEVVHHIDGDRTNNNSENLLLTTRSNHAKIHMKEIIEGQKKKALKGKGVIK